MLIIHQPELLNFLRSHYTRADVRALRVELEHRGTFAFPAFPNGLFSASASTSREFQYTGYGAVWVRDNIHVAHAHWVTGETEAAIHNIQALLAHFERQVPRMEWIIAGGDKSDVMRRPHIRFDGDGECDLPEKWAHAQNDALGAMLWFASRLARRAVLRLSESQLSVLEKMVDYLEAIEYWHDADNGHWEEAKKVEASSVGCVVAGLREFRGLLSVRGDEIRHRMDRLIRAGEDMLERILPSECIEPDNLRHFDAALLFLIEPFGVVTDTMADKILRNVIDRLQGPYGIRRYIGDSYWCSDYKRLLDPTQRVIDVSDDMAGRDALLREGQEAQWCLFDPVLSVIYGRRYQKARDPFHLKWQTFYLNRSVGQLTGDGLPFAAYRCPESYYSEQGRYIPNDVTPLLWTQANLLLALTAMEDSAAL